MKPPRENWIRVEKTRSTNDALKQAAREGAASGTAVFALEQTGGRGRLGRVFQSPPGGAYFSVYYRTSLSPEDLASMTALAAVAVCRGLSPLCPGAALSIKWPNDVLLSGRKVCGILCESLFDGSGSGIVIGIGINVRRSALPAELDSVATSLEAESGLRADPERVALAVTAVLDELASGWPERRPSVMEEYRRLCGTLGRQIVWAEDGRSRRGRAAGIDETGGLVVECGGGPLTLRWGEVSVRAEEDGEAK